MSKPVPVAARSKAWVCGRSPVVTMGSNPPGAWMSVSCECSVLSGSGLCDWLIPHAEESYSVCVCVSLSVISPKTNVYTYIE
jgi:hypothetical protein